MNISVLGDGAWGSAIANLLDNNGHNVCLWGPFSDYIDEMIEKRANPKFLPGVKFSKKLELTSDLAEALKDSEILVLALPSHFMRGLLEKMKPLFDPKKHVLLNIAKGIENSSLKRTSEIVSEILGKSEYAVLSGPSHAEEVYKKVPTAIVVASENENVAKKIQKAFINDFFRVYCSTDIVGVELGGALKNVLAIAAGVVDGMGLGDNTKAALLTRGIAETARFAQVFGGKQETLSGLSGLGDLIVTCYSGHSRNRFVGEKLGKGFSLDQIQKELGMSVAEGVKTTKSVYNLAKQRGIEMPIVNELYAGLYDEKDPRESIRELMAREAKSEIY